MIHEFFNTSVITMNRYMYTYIYYMLIYDDYMNIYIYLHVAIKINIRI